MRVAVLSGGRSSEHEISLASARSVLEALDPERYESVTVAIGRDGRWELGSGSEGHALVSDTGTVGTGPAETLPVPATSKAVTQTLGAVDVVLPILHGPFGEDGTVQGLLELADVPYVGAGVLASAVGMDKAVMKSVFRDAGLPVCRWLVVRAGERADAVAARIRDEFGFPCSVKRASAVHRSSRASGPWTSRSAALSTSCVSPESSVGRVGAVIQSPPSQRER